MFLGMNFYFSDKALPIFGFYRWDNKGSERDLTCFRSRVWFKLRFRDRNPRAISLPCPCCVSKINEMAGHREGEMIAPHFLSLFHVVLVRTLRSRLCYYPLNKMANQRLSMGQGVTAHKLTSNHVSILYPRTIRRHRLSGATTEVDDWQVDSSQNSVRVSQWCLGVQWVPNAEERQHFCLVPHAEERVSILPEWFWSCFGPVFPCYVPTHQHLNSKQPWQLEGHLQSCHCVPEVWTLFLLVQGLLFERFPKSQKRLCTYTLSQWGNC